MPPKKPILDNPNYFVPFSQGGFGKVQIRMFNNQQLVVVKTAKNGPKFQRVLEKEAEILSTLQHANIVSFIQQSKNSEGGVELFMEYCTGGDFWQ